MKAIRKLTASAGATVCDVPVPTIGDDGVLVKVRAASVCGTDIHIYGWDKWSQNRIKPPMTFGHEFSGEVVEAGKNVKSIKVGDKISAETHIPCGYCYTCRTGNMHLCENLKILGVDIDGAFAEYVALPEICAWKNPPEMPDNFASIQEPLGNACYTVAEGHVQGKQVVIFGDGPIGIFATAIARAFGATKIIGVGLNEYRMNMMKQMKPDCVLSAKDENLREKILDLTHGGPEVILEMSGAPKAVEDSFKVIRRMGTLVFFGIPSAPLTVDIAEGVIFKGLKMIGINGRKMFETWYQVSGLVANDRLDLSSVMTHEFKLEEIDEAMRLLDPKNPQAGKIVLRP